MKETRKQARQFLNDAPLQTFWQVVNDAKISDEDKEILDLIFVHGWPMNKVAQDKFMSPEKIKMIAARAYDKIAKLI